MIDFSHSLRVSLRRRRSRLLSVEGSRNARIHLRLHSEPSGVGYDEVGAERQSEAETSGAATCAHPEQPGTAAGKFYESGLKFQ